MKPLPFENRAFDPALIGHLRDEFGDRSEAIVSAALAEVHRLAEEWGVEIDGWLPGGTCSLVLTTGERVLRVPLLDWERATSLPMLLAFSGHGGVEILASDSRSGGCLMPRLRPGTPLGADEVGACADLILRLRQAEGDAPPLERFLQTFGERREIRADVRPDLLDACRHDLRRLLETSPPPRLLHGDLHHLNILRHGDVWISIDPEGMMGDPAYEPAAFLRNPIPEIGDEPNLPELLRQRILRFSQRLGDPPERIWAWARLRTVLCIVGEKPYAPWVRVAVALDSLRREFALD